MDTLPKDIYLFILFNVPGLLIIHLVYTFTDRVPPKKIEWKKIILYSTFSMYCVYLFSVILNKCSNNSIDMLELSLNSLTSIYLKLPVFLLVLIFSFLISLFVVIIINTSVLDKAISKIRVMYGYKKQSNISLWTEKLCGKNINRVVKVIFQDHEEIGILHKNSNDNSRQIELKIPKIFVKQEIIVNKVIKNQCPESKYIDITNNCTIYFYNKDKILQGIRDELGK